MGESLDLNSREYGIPVENANATLKTNLIGVIVEALTEMQGADSLINEMLQNADDANATEFAVSISNDNLTIYNDTSFEFCKSYEDDCDWQIKNQNEICDFHAILSIREAHKGRKNKDLIGKFGVGFNTVYQYTDTPEIISAGQQLIINPALKKNAEWRTLQKTGTRVILPWARDENSILRKRLSFKQTFQKTDIDEITKSIINSIGDSLLFLKNLRSIKVYRDSNLLVETKRIDLKRGDLDIRQIIKGSEVREFLILSGNAGPEMLEAFRNQPDVLESNNSPNYSIAIPKDISDIFVGSYYAYLPTQESTGLPLHINGAFFPSNSRRNLHFSGITLSNYAKWNEVIINKASSALSINAVTIVDFIGFEQYLKLVKMFHALHEMNFRATHGKEKVLKFFWSSAKIHLPNIAFVKTISGAMLKPVEVCLIPEKIKKKEERHEISSWGIELIDDDLKKFEILLALLGSKNINLEYVIEKYSKSENYYSLLTKSKEDIDKILEKHYSILEVFISIAFQSYGLEFVKENLQELRIFLGEDNRLSSFQQLRILETKATKEVKHIHMDLFPDLRLLRKTENFPATLDKLFSPIDPSDIDIKISGLKINREIANKIYRYLDVFISYWMSKTVSYDVILSTKIWPLSDGTFVAASDALLPGDFKDPLGFAKLIDMSKLDEKSVKLLKNVFKPRELNFKEYLITVLPKVFSNPNHGVSIEKYRALIQEISAKKHSNFDQESFNVLKFSFIVLSESGVFVQPSGAYAPEKELYEIFGAEVSTWVSKELWNNSENTRSFFKAIGVSTSIDPIMSLDVVRNIVANTKPKDSARKVENILRYTHAKNLQGDIKYHLDLQNLEIFPVKENNKWSKANNLIPKKRKNLVSELDSYQILAFDYDTDSFIKWLEKHFGLNSEPKFQDVLINIDLKISKNIPTSTQVYDWINDYLKVNRDSSASTSLIQYRDKELIYLNNKYVNTRVLYSEMTDLPNDFAVQIEPAKYVRWMVLFTALAVPNRPDIDRYLWILGQIVKKFQKEKKLEAQIVILYERILVTFAYEFAKNELKESQLNKLRSENFFLSLADTFKAANGLFFIDSHWISDKFGSQNGHMLFKLETIEDEFLSALRMRRSSTALRSKRKKTNEKTTPLEKLSLSFRERSKYFDIIFKNLFGKLTGIKSWSNVECLEVSELSVLWWLEDGPYSSTEVESSEIVFLDQVQNLLYINSNALVDVNGSRTVKDTSKFFKELLNQIASPYVPDSDLQNTSIALISIAEQSVEKCEAMFAGAQFFVNSEVGSGDISSPLSLGETPDELYSPPNKEIFLRKSQRFDDRKSDTFQSRKGKANIDTESDIDEVGNRPDREYEGNSRFEYQGDRRLNREENSFQDEDGVEEGGIHLQPRFTDRGDDALSSRAKGRASSGNQGSEVAKSYIYIEKEDKSKGQETLDRNKDLEKIAVTEIIERELAEGQVEVIDRNIERQEAGFDLISNGKFGYKYIEVKAISSRWGDFGVNISRRQLEEAELRGDEYWIYVAEVIDGEVTNLHKIQNPVMHIRGFRLNSGWREIAEWQANQDGPQTNRETSG